MRRTIAILGLAVSVSASQAPAQQLNPVTINPGAGGGFNGGGINLTVPQYGPIIIYGSPYGYNGYGNYGAFGVVSPGWTAPIPGYGGYGFAPGGYNIPPTYDDPLYRQQQYAMNASRYNLQNAQATKAYQEANFFQQQAIATAMNNAQQAPAVREQFNVRSAAPRSRSRAPRQTSTVPLDQLITKDGAVLWPQSSPVDPSRERVDTAIAAIAKQYQDDGKATVQSVNEARNALSAYGHPALTEVRKERPQSAAVFKSFLNNLDVSLAGMAK
ncbi:MAG: hypothetical protein JWN86_637 [Planctomycetota bacterium]|nr:hypothetical protein [Planctomycetota bacterium]